MARNTKTIDYRDDYYHGPAAIYNRWNMKTAVKLGNLEDGTGLILDFGCGVGHLKKALRKSNVVNYDIIPELSEISDYQELKPDKIVLISVLEHLHLDEIDKLMKDFLLMNPKAELTVLLPTENFVSKIAMRLAGQSNAHDDHVSKYKDINKIIEKYYHPQKRVYNFLRMAQITKYINRNQNRIKIHLPVIGSRPVKKGDNIQKALGCAVCNAEAFLEAEFDDIKLYRCFVCKHCFTDKNSLNSFEDYKPQYYETNWSCNPNYELFDFISRYISKVCPSGSVIDIGCGHGDFLLYLQKINPEFSLVGIDLSHPPKTAGINFISGDFMAAEFSQTYDIVVSLAVIEHIGDVRNFVKKIYRICKSNGYIFLMTVDDQSLLYKTARTLNRIGLKQPFERLYSRHHLNHFNVSSLRRLLVSEGFSCVETFHHNIPIESADTGFGSVVMDFCARIGLSVIFAFGKITKKTYLQTVICRK